MVKQVVKLQPDIERKFGSRKALEKYIDQEAAFWTQAIGRPYVSIRGPLGHVHFDYGSVINQVNGGHFETGEGRISLPVFIMPFRDSPAGQALVKLIRNEEVGLAQSLILAFWKKQGWLEQFGTAIFRDSETPSISIGELLIHLSDSMFSEGIASQAQDRLQTQLQEAEKLNHDITSKLAKNEEEVSEALQKSRRQVERKASVFSRWTKLRTVEGRRTLTGWQKKWDETHFAYTSQLAYKAPVALWEATAKQHTNRARIALFLFVVTSGAVLLSLFIGLLKYREALIDLLQVTECIGGNCTTKISPLAPFAAGAVLLSLTLVLWSLRLASKVYLSERHLSISASERKYFTQTYLALVQDNSVSREQEAIVLASLFRPSQDGIVSDNESTIDVSLAAILAKAVSK